MHTCALHSSCSLWVALEGIYCSSHPPVSCFQPAVRPQDPAALAPGSQHPKGSPHYDPTDTEAECMGALSHLLQLSRSFPGAEVDEVETGPEKDGRGMGETRYWFGPDTSVCLGV